MRLSFITFIILSTLTILLFVLYLTFFVIFNFNTNERIEFGKNYPLLKFLIQKDLHNFSENRSFERLNNEYLNLSKNKDICLTNINIFPINNVNSKFLTFPAKIGNNLNLNNYFWNLKAEGLRSTDCIIQDNEKALKNYQNNTETFLTDQKSQWDKIYALIKDKYALIEIPIINPDNETKSFYLDLGLINLSSIIYIDGSKYKYNPEIFSSSEKFNIIVQPKKTINLAIVFYVGDSLQPGLLNQNFSGLSEIGEFKKKENYNILYNDSSNKLNSFLGYIIIPIIFIFFLFLNSHEKVLASISLCFQGYSLIQIISSDRILTLINSTVIDYVFYFSILSIFMGIIQIAYFSYTLFNYLDYFKNGKYTLVLSLNLLIVSLVLLFSSFNFPSLFLKIIENKNDRLFFNETTLLVFISVLWVSFLIIQYFFSFYSKQSSQAIET